MIIGFNTFMQSFLVVAATWPKKKNKRKEKQLTQIPTSKDMRTKAHDINILKAPCGRA